jgi:hypothetical protein
VQDKAEGGKESMSELQKESSYQILITAIMDWMKRNGQQFVPSYKEIAKDLNIPNMLTSFSQCKRNAFKKLQKDGYMLEFSQQPNTCNAKIIGFKSPDGVGEKVASKILNIEEETPPKPKTEGIKWHEDKPKIKPDMESLDDDSDKEVDSVAIPHKSNESKPKPPFLFYSNKPVCTPRDLEDLGRMLICIAMVSEGKRLDVKVKIMEGGEG